MNMELNNGRENTILLSWKIDFILVFVVDVGLDIILYRSNVAKRIARLLKKAVFNAKFDNNNFILGYISINDVNACCDPVPIVAKRKTVPICICIQNKYENSTRMALCDDFRNQMVSLVLSVVPVFVSICDNCQNVIPILNAVKATRGVFHMDNNAFDPCL